MTGQTIPADKLRALLTQWEGFSRDDLAHVSAAGVLKELRDLLPPAPLPDPLFGAWATHPEHGEGIVGSYHLDEDGEVKFIFRSDGANGGTGTRWAPPSTLKFHTPDVSKNEAEIDTSTEHVDPIDTRPDHPVFLESEEDYENAPEGTIVARNEMWPYVLTMSRWEYPHQNFADHEDMAGSRRRVLRWGWEA